MNQEIIEILKEIKSEAHLEILLPQKISNSLKTLGMSLYEICQLTEDQFGKIYGLGKTKFIYLSEFNEQIKNKPQLITSFKKHIVDAPIVLPVLMDANKSLVSTVYQTLTDFTQLLIEKVDLPFIFFGKVEFNTYSNLYQYIYHYFGVNNTEVLSLKEIGIKFGTTDETVRTNLFDYKKRADLVDLFLHNEIGFGIKINELLVEESKKMIDDYLYSSKFIENFIFNDNTLSELQLKRLVEVFGCTIETVNFEDSDYVFQTILKKDELLVFKAHYKVLNSILRNGLKLTKDELVNKMKLAISNLQKQANHNKIKANGLNEKMFNVILDEYYKLEIVEEDEKKLYQFKWQYLSSQIAKSTRILFENDCIMSKQEIFEEFQNRENELGLELSIESIDFFHIKKTDIIHPQGKSGFWFYDENYTKEKNSLAQKVNKDIITKFNGKVFLDQFIQFTESKDFYRNYEISSIKTNVLLCCKQAVIDSNLYIHNDYKEKYPEIELKGNRNKYLGNSIIKIIANIFKVNEKPIEKNELINIIIEKLSEDNISVNFRNSIYLYLLKYFEQGILIKNEDQNSFYFQLDKTALSKFDIEKIGKKQEPIYKTTIRAKAITYLKNHQKVKLSEVFELVKNLAPAENAKTNIYKIFNNTSLFIKETIGTDVWISLDTPNLPVPKEMHVEVSEESTEVLGTNQVQIRQLYNTVELKSAIINELFAEIKYYGLNQEIISKTIDSFINITINNQRNSVWGKTLVQSIYENFCTKTDIYDRQICVMNLVGSYETFLKLISPLSEIRRASGIVEIINSMPELQDLYTFKHKANFLPENKQKKNFSYIINSAKYYADLYRHDRAHDDLVMGNSKLMKSIVDFTALYLNTLYLLNRY